MADEIVVTVQGVGKTFGKTEVLHGVSLTVERGQVLALLGPSGAGKSTLLRIVAGVERPSAGTVQLFGEDVTDVPAWKRNVAMAFESYVLYPNRTVRENMEFPLRRLRKAGAIDAQEVEARIEETAKLLEISELLDRRPYTLSGGQRQRVALGRALVRQADTLLLDEPIAHLDAKLRHWLRGELRRRLRALGTATIWATPDSMEAMAVADQIAVIVGGRIEQIGTPQEVFSQPASTRVAGLVGDPPMNLLRATRTETGIRLASCDVAVPLAGTSVSHESIVLGVRPGDLHLAPTGTDTSTPATVVVTERGARRNLITLRVGEQTLRVLSSTRDLPSRGDDVHVEWGGARVLVFAGEGDALESEEVVVPPVMKTPIGGGGGGGEWLGGRPTIVGN